MSDSRPCIFGAVIRAKAQHLAREINNRLTRDIQITKKLLEDSLERYKNRWGLEAFRLHGEAEDVDLSIFVMETGEVRARIGKCHLKRVFNCNESGLYYKMAPDRTIASSVVSERRSQESRITFLTCCSAHATEKLPLMIIVTASKVCCFQKNTGVELALFY